MSNLIRCHRFRNDCPGYGGTFVYPDCRTCIVFAQDYERDLMHDTGEDEFDNWLVRQQDEEDEYLRR